MLVDGGIGFDPTGIADAARSAEEVGYDGVWAAETGHDPFLSLAIASQATEHLELGTAIAVAFARNPMTLALTANDLQELSHGRFILGLGSQIKPHITKRYSMPWSHPAPRMREMILAIRAIWESLDLTRTAALQNGFSYTLIGNYPPNPPAPRTTCGHGAARSSSGSDRACRGLPWECRGSSPGGR